MTKKVNDKKRVTNKINVQAEAEQLLKTLALLEKPYPINYLVNLLTGSTLYGWKKAGHPKLETFGSLSKLSPVRIYRLIQILIDKQMVEGTPRTFSNIQITLRGETFLASPRKMVIRKKRLKYTHHDYLLFQLLKETRTSFSQQESKKETKILPQFTLERIAYLKPKSMKDLAAIQGMGKVRLHKLGLSILNAVNHVLDQQKREYEMKKLAAIKAPTFQQTKELWEKGYSQEEISKIKGIKLESVHQYLERLHLAGEVDMRPWIEKNVDSKELFMGVEFFKQVENGRLKEAFEATGIDYQVLRLCKLYVHGYKTETINVSMAA